MKWYEGMFIVNPTLRGEDVDKTLSEVEGEIKKLKGEVVDSRRLGKKNLAYPIDKQREGLYWLVYFKIDPAQLEPLNRKLHLKEEITRLLILQSSEQAMKNAHISIDEVRVRETEFPEY